MCTRADRASVSESAHALLGSFVALVTALAALVVAVITAPVRSFQTRKTRYGRPASIADIQVQVYLNDRERVTAIERSCRLALTRAARTWAPFPLPLDRVEVIPSAPTLGRAEIFGEWIALEGESGTLSLVIVSIGTSADGRDLTADEIAGALAGQVERLVVERYQREHPRAQAFGVASESGREPVLTTAGGRPNQTAFRADNVTDLDEMRAILADIKKSQPLVPAGSFTDGVFAEPDPAS